MAKPLKSDEPIKSGKSRKPSRRQLLLGAAVVGGGLVIGYVASRPARRPTAAKAVAAKGEQMMATWIKVAPDNVTTIYVPHSEMGQGVHTAMAMMAAEEMEADWSLVRIEQAPALPIFANDGLAKGYLTKGAIIPSAVTGIVDFSMHRIAEVMNLQITGGSTAVRYTGRYGMCVAGAAAKDMLIRAAAERWNVPDSSCTAAMSKVSHAPSGRSATFGELAAEAARLSPDATPVLKERRDYKIVGRPIQRVDIPAKVDGSAQYGIDARLPGMLYAAILHAPVWGGEVASLDATAALARRGVKKVVQLPGAVAVVADNYWRAEQALPLVKVSFTDTGHGKVTSKQIYDRQDADLADDGKSDVTRGDAAKAFSVAQAEAAKVVEATYRAPYLAHACMEPMNCTVALKDGKAECWVSAQDNLAAAAAVAKAAGISVHDVTVHPVYLGGGFGRRTSYDYIVQAVKLAQEAGAPVKLVWSREQDIRSAAYRPAITSKFRAALSHEGQPVGWSNRYTGKNEPAEAAHIPYAVADQSIRYVESGTHVPTMPWRSVAHSAHAYFTESFVDELAHAAGKDPYAYRRELLKDAPRHRRVLDLAAQKAGWGTPLPPGRARGIALQESFGSIVAEVAEITVSPAGALKVDRVVAAVDCGLVVNPDTAAQQVESGILFGLTAALYGQIDIKDGSAAQSNFSDYRMLKLGEAPAIEVYFVDSAFEPGGLGEPATPPIAPALANAVFAATGQRIRELPLKNHPLQVAQPKAVA